MIEQDTVRLLRECDAGVKMGLDAINEVYNSVSDANFKALLRDSKREHESLQDDILRALDRYGDEGKNPNPMAQGMSWIKTNVRLAVDDSDKTVSDLITDGCNMGVKSLHKYLNEYKAADEQSKDITKRLVNIEERLCIDIRRYL